MGATLCLCYYLPYYESFPGTTLTQEVILVSSFWYILGFFFYSAANKECSLEKLTFSLSLVFEEVIQNGLESMVRHNEISLYCNSTTSYIVVWCIVTCVSTKQRVNTVM